MAVVVFDITEFRGIYPEFAAVPDERLQFFFDMATSLIDNSESSPVPYSPPVIVTRKTILYALVCHLATLSQRGSGAVGVITNAAEGSVSTGFSMPINPSAAWYQQTQCGAFAWQLMTPFIVGGRAYRGCFR